MKISIPEAAIDSDNPVITELGTYEEFVNAMHFTGWRFLNNKTPNIITSEPPSDKSDGFPLQRLPSGVSMGVNSGSSYRTESRSHLGSALHDSKQRTNCISRPDSPEGELTNVKNDSKIFKSTLHNNYEMEKGGTIHPSDKSGGILYPSTPRYKDTGIVSTHPIIAGGYGPFLELKCPPDQVITINGANQRPLLRHYLSIRCRDDTGYELPGGTRISIMYLDDTGKPRENLWLFYDEISQTRGSRFKQEGERYYLKEAGIRLGGGEKLAFYVYESDIDIVKTDILLRCDIFVKGRVD